MVGEKTEAGDGGLDEREAAPLGRDVRPDEADVAWETGYVRVALAEVVVDDDRRLAIHRVQPVDQTKGLVRLVVRQKDKT